MNLETIATAGVIVFLLLFCLGGFAVANTRGWIVKYIIDYTGERKRKIVYAVTEIGAVYKTRRIVDVGISIISVERLPS